MRRFSLFLFTCRNSPMHTRHRLSRALLLSVVCCICLSCGTDHRQQPQSQLAEADMSTAKDFAPSTENSSPVANNEQTQAERRRMMIYTADLRLRVNSVDTSHARVRSLLAGYDAYLVSDNRTTSYAGQVENAMTIRVAQPQFDRLLDAVLKQAVYVDKKDIRSSDVTQEFVDLEARLKSRQLAEEQYRDILKRATKISEILEVQKYLNEIREEIEAAQGRMRYLQNQAAYSTISVVFYEREEAATPPEETFAGRLESAFSTGWQGLQKLVVGLVALWPFWLLAGLAVYLTFRWSRHSKARQARPVAIPVQPEGKSTVGTEKEGREPRRNE